MTEVLHSKQLGHLSLLQQGNLQQLVLLLGGCEDPQLSGEPTCTKHTIVLSAQYMYILPFPILLYDVVAHHPNSYLPGQEVYKF